MNQRNVPKFVPIVDLVYAFGVEKEAEGQRITITDSKVTFRRLGRVHIAGIILNVVERETKNGKKYWYIQISDGYTITLTTFDPKIGALAKENIGNLVEATVVSRVHVYKGRDWIRWYAEAIAPTQPENFIAHQILILKNLKEDLGTLDPEEMIKTYNDIMKIYTDDTALDETLDKVLKAKKVPAKKINVFKRQSRDKKLKYIAEYYNWPEEILRFVVDKIDYDAWLIEYAMSFEEEATTEDTESGDETTETPDDEFEMQEIE